MDEKISEVMARKFHDLVVEKIPYKFGRKSCYIDQTSEGNWVLFEITPSGNRFPSGMDLNTFLHHLPNAEKT